jgi:hypothetical protein
MNTGATHRLVGYDKATGRVAVEYEIPPYRLEHAKSLAGVGGDDPEAVLCYRLSAKKARDLAAAVGAPIDTGTLNFFLEGFAAAR